MRRHRLAAWVPDGESATPFSLAGLAGVVAPPGWQLQAQLGEALGGAGPVRFVSPYILVNQGPARADQGGAY